MPSTEPATPPGLGESHDNRPIGSDGQQSVAEHQLRRGADLNSLLDPKHTMVEALILADRPCLCPAHLIYMGLDPAQVVRVRGAFVGLLAALDAAPASTDENDFKGAAEALPGLIEAVQDGYAVELYEDPGVQPQAGVQGGMQRQHDVIEGEDSVIPATCPGCGERHDDGPTDSSGQQWCGECPRDGEPA